MQEGSEDMEVDEAVEVKAEPVRLPKPLSSSELKFWFRGSLTGRLIYASQMTKHNKSWECFVNILAVMTRASRAWR